MKLGEHVALVTGANSGMGYVTAQHLGQLGFKPILVDLTTTAAEALAKTFNTQAYACSVSDAEGMEKIFADIQERFGVPRVVVNCAGIAPAQRVCGREGPHSLDAFQRVIEVNLLGTFNVLRLAAHALSTSEPINDDGERGVIINTASVAAYEGQIGQAAYSASKGGVVSMTLPAAP